jgi:hypothetical protein
MSIIGAKNNNGAPLPEIGGAYPEEDGFSSVAASAAITCQLEEGKSDDITYSCLARNMGSVGWMLTTGAGAEVVAASSSGVLGLMVHVPTLIKNLPSNPQKGPVQLFGDTMLAQNNVTPGGWFGAVDMTSLTQPGTLQEQARESATRY